MEVQNGKVDTKATGACGGFNIDTWVGDQKAKYGSREGLPEILDERASQYNSTTLGLSGKIIDLLTAQRPHIIVPKAVWGSDLGWRSVKRQKSWESLLVKNGIVASPTDSGLLIRFYFDPTEWVPHPYTPPSWATRDYETFSRCIISNEEVFKLCVQWKAENALSLTSKLIELIREFPVQVGAQYVCHEHADYADVAFILPDCHKELLQINTIWKGECSLAALVKNIFPDACREYSPSWLGGQRIDIFIPSIQVGLEYQGAQHYESVEYFGGDEGFRRIKERDVRKAIACRNAGIALTEWKYTEPANELNLKRKLEEIGIEFIRKF